MADISFYHQLADDFVESNFTSFTIVGKIYNGLTPSGFSGNRKLDLSNFRVLELVATLDVLNHFSSSLKILAYKSHHSSWPNYYKTILRHKLMVSFQRLKTEKLF